VIYLDAPGTYNALYDSKEFVDMEMVLVYTPASTVATLTLYAATVVTDDTANIGQFANAAGVTGAETEQFSIPWAADMSPLSQPGKVSDGGTVMGGLSAVLAGAGAKAWIYVV
jgi:hypothetical protein